ncbi:MAG TPA: SWIM zinc finger family protein [Ktedonobacterales bacterium]|nr:SWIM zinc finger family protein [Ktedonobacterales bacterium]
MAAAAKMTDARTRSIELAQARGETPCSWAARTLGWTLDDATGALVSLALAIHSAHSEQVYSVGYRASVDDATCDCPAARYGRPCWHRGLGVLKGRSVARLYSPAGRAEAERAYRADLAAEDNARALGYH